LHVPSTPGTVFLTVMLIIAVTAGLDYDVLLIHADSDATNEFGELVRRKLTEMSQPPYAVFHYSGNDFRPGQGEHAPRSAVHLLDIRLDESVFGFGECIRDARM